MNITESQRSLLAAVEMQADKPGRTIVDETGIALSEAQQQLRSLEEAGILTRLPMMNVAAMGLAEHVIYFELLDSNAERKFINLLMQSSDVSWVIKFEKDQWYGVCFRVADVYAFHESLDDLTHGFEQSFGARHHLMRTQFSLLGRKYLNNHPENPVTTPTPVSQRSSNLLRIDLRVVEFLAKQRPLDLAAVATHLNLPPADVMECFEELERANAITAIIYEMNTREFGMRCAKALFSVRGMGPAVTREIREFAHRHKRVWYLASYLGEWDFELGFDYSCESELDQFEKSVSAQLNETILTIKTLPIERYLKRENYSF